MGELRDHVLAQQWWGGSKDVHGTALPHQQLGGTFLALTPPRRGLAKPKLKCSVYALSLA